MSQPNAAAQDSRAALQRFRGGECWGGGVSCAAHSARGERQCQALGYSPAHSAAAAALIPAFALSPDRRKRCSGSKLTHICSSLRKIYLCNVVFVSVNMVEDIEMEKIHRFCCCGRANGCAPGVPQKCNTCTWHQSCSLLQHWWISQCQMAQKCQRSPAMLHLPQIHSR